LANFFVKHWRLILLVLGIIVFLWVLYLMRTVVLPFAIALVLAYLLMPAVSWLEKRLPPRKKWPGFRRVFSVLLSFILLAALLGGFAYFIVTAVIDASVVLTENAPYFIGKSMYQIQAWLEGVVEKLPIEWQQDASTALVEGGISLGRYIRDVLMGAVSFLPSTFAMIFGFAVLPFFLFYVMKDRERLKAGLSTALTPRFAEHGRNIADIVEMVLGRYIRAQLMLAVIVGYFTFLGLWILKIPFTPALAILAGVGEIIPTLGPWIAGVVAGVVTLAMAPDKLLWVVILFVAVQLLENNLLVPKIQSAYLRIHPAVMIVLLVFGAYIAGIWGLILVGPLVATAVEVFKYIRNYYKTRNEEVVPEEEASPP
jgi:predicted PurR-regulated permease PerM